MSNYIALIRHGDYHQRLNTPSAHQAYPLNAIGKQQAQTAIKTLSNMVEQHAWTLSSKIDSSELLRAWQTAQLIGEGLWGLEKFQIECFSELAERGVGAVANLSLSEIEDIIDHDPRYPSLTLGWKSDSHFRLPFIGAESLLDAGKRVADHLNSIINKMYADKKVNQLKLVVGHGASFRHAAYHLGVLNFDQIAKLSMYHCAPVVLECDTSGQWRSIAGEWKVRAPADQQSID